MQTADMELLRKSFLTPANEYTPFPFWFWNDHLTEDELARQICDFKAHGVMGFVIHPRKGMPKNPEYLSPRYMDLVRFAVEEAARLDMEVILYDEAMYPSGSAHGLVAKENPRWASRCLVMEIADDSIAADESGCLPGWETHSGWVAYETELKSPEHAMLDLGKAHEMARIVCNGKEIAHKLWGPYTFALPEGNIRLRIEICNTLCNRWEGKPLPSGLLGPVCLSI